VKKSDTVHINIKGQCTYPHEYLSIDKVLALAITRHEMPHQDIPGYHSRKPGYQDIRGIKQDMTRDTIYHLEALDESYPTRESETRKLGDMPRIPPGYLLKTSNLHSTH
jgi:hypothetical protein